MAEDLANRFEPLYSTQVQGTGLGLSLGKQLVEQLGGKIALHSQVHQGTMVSLHLSVPLSSEWLLPHES